MIWIDFKNDQTLIDGILALAKYTKFDLIYEREHLQNMNHSQLFAVYEAIKTIKGVKPLCV